MRPSRLRQTAARHWRAMIVATCVAAAVVAASLAWSRSAPPAHQPQAGYSIGYSPASRPAPPFSLPLLAGHGSVRLSALAGRPIVVNFWASSCAPCRQESPAIAQVASTLAGRVAFVGVDTSDERAAALSFARKNHMTYDLGYDPQGSTAASYRVPALPETVFLSRSGRTILAVNLGALTAPRLRAILHNLYGITG